MLMFAEFRGRRFGPPLNTPLACATTRRANDINNAFMIRTRRQRQSYWIQSIYYIQTDRHQ